MINGKSRFVLLASTIIISLLVFSDFAHASRRGGRFPAPPPPAVTPNWTSLTGSSTTDSGNDIAIDGKGNVVVVGTTFGSINGDPLQGNQDIFIAKYNKTGDLLWTHQIGTVDYERYAGINIDSSGNIYAVGSSTGSLAASNQGGNDIILDKYDSDGNLLWIRQYGTSGTDRGNAVGTDSSGNVYICGETSGSFGAANTTFNTDAYLARLDSAGDIQWIDQFSSSPQLGSGESCNDLAVDVNDNIYITGFTPGALQAGASGAEFYVKKYDPADHVIWLTERDSVYYNVSNSIAVDAVGNTYVAGTGGLDSPVSGLADAFIVKFDEAGVEQWNRLLQSTGQESMQGIAVDAAGKVYAAGFTSGSIAAANSRDTDILLARYDSNGRRLSLVQKATTSWDQANGIAVNSDGTDYYLVGSTDGDLDGEINNGAYDLFVTRNRP